MSRRGGHFFEEFLIETKSAKTMTMPAGPNNYRAPSLGPILVRKRGGYKIGVATLD